MRISSKKIFLFSKTHPTGGQQKATPKLTVWSDRKSPVNRTSPGRFTAARARSDSRRPRHLQADRFSNVQSQPGSPMTDQSPLYWFVKDIDIGDKGGSLQNYPHQSRRDHWISSGRPPIPPGRGGRSSTFVATGSDLVRNRSRNNSHFELASPMTAGKIQRA